MYVNSIVIKNFRNIASLDLTPHRRINIYLGDNAQGKTNLLEALYYINKGRSFRTARDRDLIRWNEKHTYLAAELIFKGQKVFVEVGISAEGDKLYKMNGKKCNQSQLQSLPGVVLFTPEDMFLVKGAPQQRRTFLDNEVGQSLQDYIYYLRQYRYTLEQRNNLIRGIARKKQGASTLGVWDEQLASFGAKLIRKRLSVLKELSEEIKPIHARLSNGEEIGINYLSSFPLTEKLEEEIIKKDFLKVLHKKREEELFRQQTLSGPHRDDLRFMLNGVDARSFASQGQQRTVVLSLKVSLFRLMHRWNESFPLLLLDDVLFELDENRRSFLLQELEKDVQVFLTSNKLDHLSGINREYIQYFYINGGIIEERG